jgi:ABC-type branched-subunit amino acid transport system substrate-binding protein
MVGAYGPCAAFIKLARQYDLNAIFLNVSFVGSVPLARELGDDGEGVVITQVVPHFESDAPVAIAYREALSASDTKTAPSFVALEGYVAGRILIKALQSLSEIPTRETVVTAFKGMGPFDLGLGSKLYLSQESHQASHQVWPTIIRGGKVIPLEWSELRQAIERGTRI